jgi:hypothetical protein
MSLLSRLESIFEAIFEGGPRWLFRPQLQPIEITHALDRAMAAEKVVSPSSVDVPNAYRAHLNPADFQRLTPLRSTIERDAAVYLERRAQEMGFHPITAIRVELVSDPSVRASFVRAGAVFDEQARAAVDSIERTSRMEPVPVAGHEDAFLLVAEDGRELRVGEQPLKLGRARDNDFVIRDVRVSRYHAVIEPASNGWVVRDLESTNGTFVDGKRINQIAIAAPTEISLGGCRLVPRAA